MPDTKSLTGVTGSRQVKLGPGLPMSSEEEAPDPTGEAEEAPPDCQLPLAPESGWCVCRHL